MSTSGLDAEHLELAINSLSEIRDKTVWLLPPNEEDMIELIESIHELAKLTVRKIKVEQNPPVPKGTFNFDE